MMYLPISGLIIPIRTRLADSVEGPHGLEATESQWSDVATVGCWRPLDFAGYVDLAEDVDRDMSRLLAETDPVGSDDEKVHRLG